MTQRPPEIDSLIGTGNLHEADLNPENVERFLERADKFLKDAENSTVSDEMAFLAAYEAILSVCHAALLHYGARPSNGQGHRTIALQIGLQLLGLKAHVPFIIKIHTKRNTDTYNDPGQPLPPSAVKLTVEILQQALKACRTLTAPAPINNPAPPKP